MHDIKAIKTDPKKYEQNWARRGLAVDVQAICDVHEGYLHHLRALEDLRAARKSWSEQIGQKKRNGEDSSDIENSVKEAKEKSTHYEEQIAEAEKWLNDHLLTLPNQLSDNTPDGADENDNAELRAWGTITKETGDDHVTIGEKLGLMDFDGAAKLSGARFVVLKGRLARLERALAQFMLDTHTMDHGYTEVSPPLLVNSDILVGTGQLPKFEDDQFKTNTGHYMIPTAEVPLTNLVRDAITAEEELPLRLTAFTPCFRAEAGSAGRDTRGMLRQHQFYKVEMVSIVTPEESEAEHERMTICAETILQKLNLPYRVMMLCSGDTGFGAMKTHDLEVWLPGQQKFREISSVSNCGDFQARRMNARCRKVGDKNTRFLHTLNGSGVAVGRALIAVLENYWDGERVIVPDALQPYMGGQKYID